MTEKPTMPKPDIGVHRRAGSTAWQWRIRAPLDLRHLYKGEWAHRESLGTSDLQIANIKAAGLRSDWLSRFNDQRRALNLRRVTELTPEMSKQMADLMVHRALAIDEATRTDPGVIAVLTRELRKLDERTPSAAGSAPHSLDGMPEELAAWLANANQKSDELTRNYMARGHLTPLLEIAQRYGELIGITFDAQTPGVREALLEMLKAVRHSTSMRIARDQGDVVETPPAPASRNRSMGEPTTLREVYERWVGKKARSKDSLRACERALALFEERSGNPPVVAITRAQGDDFRSWLQTLGTSSKTAHDRLTWVKSLLVYAYRDLELIPRQPWEGIDIEHKTENRRKPWTAQQLQTLFSQPLFTEYALPTVPNAGKDAAYWVPLIGIYTGARIGELSQLLVKDIDESSGVPAITISDEGADQQVKTDAASRSVPIHSELHRLGFLDYVAATRAAGHARLFPDLRLRAGKPGGYFSAWFGESKPEGLPDFHSFRHTVRSLMAEAGISEPVMDRITGHTVKGSTGTKVYTHVSPKTLQRAVEAVRYPSLSLPKAYGAPARPQSAT